MPVHKSAIKRVRQSLRRRLHNRARKSTMRTLIKAVFAQTEKATAAGYLTEASSFIDRMAKRGTIHKNRAAAYKSRLAVFVNKLA